MKFENTEVFNIKGAMRGMRNPLQSHHKSDSFDVDNHTYLVGVNDIELGQRLIRSGAEHRKFLRQIVVSVDISAPLYWFSEFDTYKIGTTANSTSKMHKLASTPITMECIETDDYQPEFSLDEDGVHKLVSCLETLRQKYLETKDKRYWKELVRWLPESWLQTRTITMNYENIYSMIRQRKNHKLTEWSVSFINWAKSLPYAEEWLFLDFGLEESNLDSRVEKSDNEAEAKHKLRVR